LGTSNRHIVVFEHQCIKLNQEVNGVRFDEHKLKALQNYYGEKGVPYFSLTHNGVRFNEYVGIIQIGGIVIEVLPKADNAFAKGDEKKQWHNILIDMLFAVGTFEIHSPSSSALKLKSNSILDLYFELFINEVEYILHNGLVKQYRKKEGNVTALKGSLQFNKQIQYNLIHHERFYVRHTCYDVDHKLHFILYKTIRLLKQINTNASLHSRIGSLLLVFPKMPDIKVTEGTFEKLVFTRKNQPYKKAIDIAKLLLLHYHPDVSEGRNNVLALMFDMNNLWEQFVYVSLRKHKETTISITAQTSKSFWMPESGYRSKIRPDIVVNKDKPDCLVLDTKWKNLYGYNPSPDDLRQMYVYHEYYAAKRVALVYPGATSTKTGGKFLDPKSGEKTDKECCLISLSVESNIKKWQENIYNNFIEWLDLSSTQQ
jgi:5-methylcytosine-specific restriction enzyme subunit McrC